MLILGKSLPPRISTALRNKDRQLNHSFIHEGFPTTHSLRARIFRLEVDGAPAVVDDERSRGVVVSWSHEQLHIARPGNRSDALVGRGGRDTHSARHLDVCRPRAKRESPRRNHLRQIGRLWARALRSLGYGRYHLARFRPQRISSHNLRTSRDSQSYHKNPTNQLHGAAPFQ